MRVCALVHAVKMHPPGVPSVNSTANETWISWNRSSPRSVFIKSCDFEVQIKQKKQAWKVRGTHIRAQMDNEQLCKLPREAALQHSSASNYMLTSTS